jgi:hypothetical protein
MIEPSTLSETEPLPLCDAEGPIPKFPPLALDPRTGRMLPMSDEEREARHSAAIRAIKAIGLIEDETETDEGWEEVYRNIDAARPHRKLFEGLY